MLVISWHSRNSHRSAGAWSDWCMLCYLLLPLSWAFVWAHSADNRHLERWGLSLILHLHQNTELCVWEVATCKGPMFLSCSDNNSREGQAQALVTNSWAAFLEFDVAVRVTNLFKMCYKIWILGFLNELLFILPDIHNSSLLSPESYVATDTWFNMATCFDNCHTRRRCSPAVSSKLFQRCRSTGALIAAIFITHLKHESDESRHARIQQRFWTSSTYSINTSEIYGAQEHKVREESRHLMVFRVDIASSA